MSESVTLEQMRSVVLDALSGQIQPPLGVCFNNYNNLKIGAWAALAKRGILDPQPPSTYLADAALTSSNGIIYQRVYDALVVEGTYEVLFI